MDPVNKWLAVIILFMISVLFVLWHKGGSGQYEMVVEDSTLFANHAVVYVLDTKNGNIKAQLVDEQELLYNGKTVRTEPRLVFKQPSSYNNRRY